MNVILLKLEMYKIFFDQITALIVMTNGGAYIIHRVYKVNDSSLSRYIVFIVFRKIQYVSL